MHSAKVRLTMVCVAYAKRSSPPCDDRRRQALGFS